MTAWLALPIFGGDAGRIVFLPDDAERGAIDADGDAAVPAAYDDVGDRNAAEVEFLTAVLRGQVFGCVIERHCDRPIFGSGLRAGVGQDAIKALLRRGGDQPARRCRLGQQRILPPTSKIDAFSSHSIKVTVK